MKYILASVLLTLICSFANAGYQEGQITGIIIRDSDGLKYFTMNGTAYEKPSCATASYWMIKNENSDTGKAQLSTLLAAHLSGKTVRVTGYGTCTRWGDGEDVNYIHIK